MDRTQELDRANLFDEEDDAIEQALDVAAHNQHSSYNHYGYRPVAHELRHVPLKVTGTLPEELTGIYLRNGTNTQFEETHVRLHCFNGAGMLHQVQFHKGGATYSNTYIRTPVYEAEKQAGREIFTVFSDIAGGGLAGKRKIERIEKKKQEGRIPNLSYLETVQASTAVQYHAGRILCLAEVGLPFVLNARREADGLVVLDGTGHFEDWGGTLRTAFSAHPRIDPASGDFYSVTVDRNTACVNVTHLSRDQIVNAASVYQQTAQTGSMANLHDCFLTEHFIVFADVSLRQSREWLLGPSGSVFRFDSSRMLRFGVLPRDFTPHTPVRWFETGHAGFIWHTINGWERQGANGAEIVLYAPMFHAYPDSVPIHTPQEPPSKLHKWVLNLHSGEVTCDAMLLEHGYERPSFNTSHVGRENRFAYLLDEERGGYMGKGVLKYDLLAEKELAYFDYGEFFGGEALFVPKPHTAAEDDGYLLELLMGPDAADLVVIDAASMQELARVHLPQRVPFGVHACWLDQSKVEALKT